MKIKFTDQELIQLGLKKEKDISLPSLDDDYSVNVDTTGQTTERLERYDDEYLSLASINRNKNLLVNDLHKVAFSGKYSDLIGVPALADNFRNGLLSKEDFNKLSNLDTMLSLKSNIKHTHKFEEITEVPLATKTNSGLMSEKQCMKLEGLSKVAETGLYSDLAGTPVVATEDNDGLLSAELFKEINAVAETFGSSFTQNSNGIYVYNHNHDIRDIYGIEDVVERCNVSIDNLIRFNDVYASVYAGYDNEGNYYKGLMRGEDKDKLDKIDQYANNYKHPETHPVTMIEGLATVATTGSYNDLAGTPDILGVINSVDFQNGIAIGSTGGLQIHKGGQTRMSFQRGIQYFHGSNLSNKARFQLNEENEDQLECILCSGVNLKIGEDTNRMVDIIPNKTSFTNCEVQVSGNITLKHAQDPNATGYNGLVVGTDTNRNDGKVYGEHSMGIIADHTVGFGTKTNGSEEYNAFINTRTGDMFLKGDIYIKGVIEGAYKDEILGQSIPSTEATGINVTRSIPAIAETLGVPINEYGNGLINMSDTILALLDKIEELTDTIERQEIRIRQMEKEIY